MGYSIGEEPLGCIQAVRCAVVNLKRNYTDEHVDIEYRS